MVESWCSCSLVALEGKVMGIKFYEGWKELKAFLPVSLMREPYNPHNSNSVLVTIKKGSTVLGHLEKHIAGVVAH